MKRLIFLLFCLPAFGQVSLIGTVGSYSGYKPPYVEGSVEAKHRLNHFLIGGELRGAWARKSDTGDGFHFGTRAIGAYSHKSFDFGGGVAFSKQWTSLYQKQAARPIAYFGWHDAETALELAWIFQGTDSRNGQRGLDFRYTDMFSKHWGFRMGGELLRGYQTDQPDKKIAIGGAQAGFVYRFN